MFSGGIERDQRHEMGSVLTRLNENEKDTLRYLIFKILGWFS